MLWFQLAEAGLFWLAQAACFQLAYSADQLILVPTGLLWMTLVSAGLMKFFR